jgi:hypothetical protein
MLPMVWMQPVIPREVIRDSAVGSPGEGSSPTRSSATAVASTSGPRRPDIWLLLSSAEPAWPRATSAFLTGGLPCAVGGEGTLWDHMKRAFRYQALQRGPNGGYLMGATGNWSHFSDAARADKRAKLATAQAVFVCPANRRAGRAAR